VEVAHLDKVTKAAIPLQVVMAHLEVAARVRQEQIKQVEILERLVVLA
jgi:endonuclease/exonuclease/phosphatase family metal-dependent hydrolase